MSGRQSRRRALRTACASIFVGIMALNASCSAQRAPQSAPVVSTANGFLEGRIEQGLAVYRGVPFAEPPVGERRWREPKPVQPWTGVRSADAFAPACPQLGVSMPGEPEPPTSEDCLYLNIWTPARSADDTLPVMVWIHGGGWSNGATSFRLYSGERLARRDVVVVTLAYRLGPLGFLAHRELTDESPHGTSGNYGLMDQVAALRWIRDNIEAFGGDPNRVTVFGQSAGATSISILMASPLARGLFHGAIGQSGGLFEPPRLAPRFLLDNAEGDGVEYAAAVGAASLAELRELSAADLLGGPAGAVSHPVIEPHLLPADPYSVFAAGEQHDVPLLVGSNADEARSLMDAGEVRASTFVADITRRWGRLPAPLLDAYTSDFRDDDEARQARLAFERDLRFGWDAWAWARLHAGTAGSDVYHYRFAHEPPFPEGTPYEGWGASHFAELWYVFDDLDQETWPWRADDRALADAISSYWTNFAKSGDPNGSELAEWPRFSMEQGRVLYLQSPPAVGGVPNLEQLEVFEAVYAELRDGVAP